MIIDELKQLPVGEVITIQNDGEGLRVCRKKDELLLQMTYVLFTAFEDSGVSVLEYVLAQQRADRNRTYIRAFDARKTGGKIGTD